MIASLLYRLYDDEINCLLQRDLEKLRADLQMKDRELRSVTREREHIQQSAAAVERAVKSHQVNVCVLRMCIAYMHTALCYFSHCNHNTHV